MLAQLQEWYAQLARWMGEKNNFGTPTIDANPMNQHALDYESMCNILHYESYDPDTRLYFNKNSQGFILEANPLIGASEETINILTHLLIDVLPHNADLQILLWGSDKIGDALDRFEEKRSGKGDIFEWLAKKRTDFLKKGAYQSLIKQGVFILRNFRLLISVSLPAKHNQDHTDTLLLLRDDIASSLQSIHLHTRVLDVTGLLSIIGDILHPSNNVYSNKQKWDPYDSISKQLIDTEYAMQMFNDKLVIETDGEPWEIRSFIVKDYPETMVQWKMEDAIGQLFNTSMQIPCPFILSFSIRLLDYEKSKMMSNVKSIQAKETAKSKQASWLPHLFKKLKDMEFIKERMADGDRLAHTIFQVHLLARSHEASYAERKIKDLYQSNGWILKKQKYLQLQSFLATLPMRMTEGMYYDLKRFGRIKTITAFNAVNVAPLQGEWKGTATPILILPGRRGQIATFNPFDNREGNYNVIIAAASGKGKSTFTQEYIVGLLGAGGRVWVIDIGRSYEKTCKLLEGTFIEFGPEKQVCINPFTHIKNFDESLELLKPLIAAMARPNSKVSDEENAYLEKAIKAAWEDKKNEADIDLVAIKLKNQDHPICKNLALLLYSFSNEGMYGSYVNGNSNVDLSNAFAVLELQELNNKKDLRRIIMMILMFHITQAMFLGERTQPKTLILEEMWQHFQGESEGMSDFIEAFARTVRRFTGSLVCIGQSINDFFKNSASMAVYDNSDFMIVLGQKEESIDQLAKSDRFTMNPFTERLFKSLRKTDEYSECIIKSPSGLSVHRIILDDYSKILYSSKGNEFDAVNRLQAQGLSLKEAVNQVAEMLRV